MGTRVLIKTSVFFVLPVLILFSPGKWILAWIISAAIHEAFHLLAIRLFRVKILNFEIGILGSKIEIEEIGTYKELLVALAGPLGALSIVMLSEHIPRMAVCALVQSVYNLLPVYPLDGGRVFRCLLSLRMGMQDILHIESVILAALCICCIVLSFAFKLGMLPILISACLVIKYTNAIYPCKPRRQRVQ